MAITAEEDFFAILIFSCNPKMNTQLNDALQHTDFSMKNLTVLLRLPFVELL